MYVQCLLFLCTCFLFHKFIVHASFVLLGDASTSRPDVGGVLYVFLDNSVFPELANKGLNL